MIHGKLLIAAPDAEWHVHVPTLDPSAQLPAHLFDHRWKPIDDFRDLLHEALNGNAPGAGIHSRTAVRRLLANADHVLSQVRLNDDSRLPLAVNQAAQLAFAALGWGDAGAGDHTRHPAVLLDEWAQDPELGISVELRLVMRHVVLSATSDDQPEDLLGLVARAAVLCPSADRPVEIGRAVDLLCAEALAEPPRTTDDLIRWQKGHYDKTTTAFASLEQLQPGIFGRMGWDRRLTHIKESVAVQQVIPSLHAILRSLADEHGLSIDGEASPAPGFEVTHRTAEVAVLAANVTRHELASGEQALRVDACLDALCATVAKHHGRVVEETQRGVLATFGDPYDALACALALRVAARASVADEEADMLPAALGLAYGEMTFGFRRAYGLAGLEAVEVAALPNDVNVADSFAQQLADEELEDWVEIGAPQMRQARDGRRVRVRLARPAR
jgi:hypothetical protein